MTPISPGRSSNSSKHLRCRYSEGASEANNRGEARFPDRSLKTADLGGMEAAAVTKLLLTELLAKSLPAEVGGELLVRLHAREHLRCKPKALEPKAQVSVRVSSVRARAAEGAMDKLKSVWDNASTFGRVVIVGTALLIVLFIIGAALGDSEGGDGSDETTTATTEVDPGPTAEELRAVRKAREAEQRRQMIAERKERQRQAEEVQERERRREQRRKARQREQAKRGRTTGVEECAGLPIAGDRAACELANTECSATARQTVESYYHGSGIPTLDTTAFNYASDNFSPKAQSAAMAGCLAALMAEYQRVAGG